MRSEKYQPPRQAAWEKLRALASRPLLIRELFEKDAKRATKFSLETAGIFFDYSKQRVDDDTLAALLELADCTDLKGGIDALFNGELVNCTESRPALHTALRAREADAPTLSGDALYPTIHAQKQHMRALSDAIRRGELRGATGKPFHSIVNIGIGGSDLGPRMVCIALREFSQANLDLHFIANVDGAEIHSLLQRLDAETTLFIVASKTFTTQETLLNATTARTWLAAHIPGGQAAANQHFVAITASPARAVSWGVRDDRVLEFWDWVGGRYSLWSAIGLPIAIAIGMDRFEELLDGARQMDQHFRTEPYHSNMPVLMALLGIWNSNFLGATTQAIIPYCERLGLLPAYLQQLDMESNGKSAQVDGKPVGWTTGAILWGKTGTNGQHAFFQLLHQGTHLVPVDFIGLVADDLSEKTHHRVLIANMLAQASALMAGSENADLHRHYPGNKPSNTLLFERLDARTLGAFIALHEHRVFVQGYLWNINSFDQWGVELGKVLAKQLLDGEGELLDPSTRQLMQRAL